MNRFCFFQHIAVGAIGASMLKNPALAAFIDLENMSGFFYAGSYTANREEGISIGRFDSDHIEIQLIDVCRNVSNPSFLIFDPARKFVYAANETDDYGGKKSGYVSSFRCDEKSGRLTFLNQQPSLGAHPCHLTISKSGKFLLVANYTGGNVAVLPVRPDGQLGEPVEMVQHSGKGPNTNRQESAHAHSVNLSPDNRFAVVCDLGMDKIMVYRFNSTTGKLTPAETPFFQTAPGAGPRHLTFSADGMNAFVVNELNSTITCLAYDPGKGLLTERQTLSTLPDAFTGENTCADIHIHPSGRYIYTSNRGHDSIAVFSTGEGGRMKLLQHQSTLGKTPRNFAIHASGKFLVAANQDSGSIPVFSIDPVTGRLTATGKSIQISKPVCLLF
jgi:6-phosphogluconolactonase